MTKAKITFSTGDSLELYDTWERPDIIVSDGPYGVGGFEGDPRAAHTLNEMYRPHVEAWSKHAKPGTTLWFWCSELGWATVHNMIIENGWQYKTCNVWDKGIGHIAGNTNTKSLSKLPVTTEVCVHYVMPFYAYVDGKKMTAKEWLRYEWLRTGLPLYKTNEAAGLKDAATRKYFTQSDLWYSPPGDMFQKIVDYANKNGDPDSRPYFSLDGKKSLTGKEWDDMKPTFRCPIGVTNVWSHVGLRGEERIKASGLKSAHLNQKPLSLMNLTLSISSNPGDVLWEPFGGLCSASIAGRDIGLQAYCAEINPKYAQIARKRIEDSTDVKIPTLEEVAQLPRPLPSLY